MRLRGRFTFSLGNVLLAMVPLAVLVGLLKGGLEHRYSMLYTVLLPIFVCPPALLGALRNGPAGMRRGIYFGLAIFGGVFSIFLLIGLVAIVLISLPEYR